MKSLSFEYLISPKTNGANPFKIFESLSQSDGNALAWAIKRLDYQTFLKTAYWFAVSTVVKSMAGMRCQVCNSANEISVHHRTYDTHGREHLNMCDLTVLCGNCHGLFHGHKTVPYIPPPPERKEREPRPPKPRKGFTYPHEPVTIPDGDEIVLTPELINECRANGAFTNATARAFGLKHPLVRGWVDRLVGKKLTREQYRAAKEGQYVYRSGPLERVTNGGAS